MTREGEGDCTFSIWPGILIWASHLGIKPPGVEAVAILNVCINPTLSHTKRPNIIYARKKEPTAIQLFHPPSL